MKHTTLKLVTAAMIISATALFVGGCSNKAQDIDLTLIGGDGQNGENSYTVDIRRDTEEVPVNSDTTLDISTAEPEEIREPDIPKEETTAPAKNEKPAEAAPETTPATTKAAQPAVTITTDKPQVTTPAQTVRTDLPKVTAEPQYTTAATTTTKPAKQTEPAEIKTDENGFPANPEVNQTFVDSTGTEYIYNGIFGWIQGDDGNPNIQEFPRHGDCTYGEGEQVLH